MIGCHCSCHSGVGMKNGAGEQTVSIGKGCEYVSTNEEQIISGYPIDGAIGSSGRRRVRKVSVVCLHNNAIVARGILVIYCIMGHPIPDSAPSILLVLLEPH